jgi:hypothetical protein
MTERFKFNTAEAIQVLGKLNEIALRFKESENFLGALSNNFLKISHHIISEDYLKFFDDRIKTISRYNGFKVERAWDGGFNFTDDQYLLRLERISAFLYLYWRELVFRSNSDLRLGDDFYEFNNFVAASRSQFSKENEFIFEFRDELPFYILREEYHSDHAIRIAQAVKSTDVTKVEDFINTRDTTLNKIDAWNNDYQNKLTQVQALQDKLEKHQTAFNFVGLYDGFSQLESQKKVDLKRCEKEYDWLRVGVFSIPVFELIWILLNYNILEKEWSHIVLLGLPTVSIIILLLYFIRVALHEIKSIKSQIMQIELRMTLCQFIQNYADTSKELKKNNEEAFEKFESLIFSSIVSSDENIPTTFDGMEQLASLVKLFQNKE